MAEAHTISATEFKAKCLDILDRVGRREWESVVVTKRGTPVAVVTAPLASRNYTDSCRIPWSYPRTLI